MEPALAAACGQPALAELRACFAGRLLTTSDDMAPFLTDWRRKWTGRALAVVQPENTEGVAAIVRWCAHHSIPIVAQGGNTGLSGAATPDACGNAIVLSTARLCSVRSIDRANMTITVEAGLTLQEVQGLAEEAGLLFPLSLAAQGTCTIGGNLATNAGGVQVLRYGNARELCLGLEVVTATGEVWNGLRALRKDNTGYDLRDIFVGSEGTLGIITAAVLKLFPRPTAQALAFCALQDVAAAVALLTLARERLGSGLTAFELMSDTCLSLVEKHVDARKFPLTERAPWYVLIEVSVQGMPSDAESQVAHSLESLLEKAFEQTLVSDAVLSSNLSQFKELWALREDISESQGAEGPTIKHDIALPASEIADFINETSARIGQAHANVRLVVFGHLGDGNLHFNASPLAHANEVERAAFRSLEAPLNRLVHDAIAARGGSISAEHGLGVLRSQESARYKSSVELALMQAVKSAFDPHSLFNPGKVLP